MLFYWTLKPYFWKKKLIIREQGKRKKEEGKREKIGKWRDRRWNECKREIELESDKWIATFIIYIFTCIHYNSHSYTQYIQIHHITLICLNLNQYWTCQFLTENALYFTNQILVESIYSMNCFCFCIISIFLVKTQPIYKKKWIKYLRYETKADRRTHSHFE